MRRGARFSRRGGGGAPIYAGPLLAWADGTFLRTTEGSYYTAADALAWATANTRRSSVEFGESLALIESSRTNILTRSEDFSGWSATTTTVTTNAGTAPDGDADAATLAHQSATNSRLVLTGLSTLGASELVTLSRWVKNSSGDGSTRLQLIQKDATTEVSINSTAGAAWAREVNRAASTGAGGSNPQAWHRNGSVSGARTIFAWGIQLERGRYETSYIRTVNSAVTRGADVATWSADQVPLHLRTRAWKMRVAPGWAHTDLASGDVRILLSWSADDCVRVRHDGTNVVLEAVVGGVVKATKTLTSITRRAALDVAVDPIAGTVSWGGSAGSAGTPWSWPDGSVRIGGELGGLNEWDGGLGLPETT